MAMRMPQMDPNCIFCKIAAHESPADIVFEDADFIACKDIRPEAPTHVLIMPKIHIEKLTDVTDTSLLSGLWEACVRVARQLQVDPACKFAINNGKDAGQIVPHVHVHLLSQIRQ